MLASYMRKIRKYYAEEYITLTRLVFDDASLTLPSGFTPSSSNYPEFGSTAVPEPGTFIPAAVLVAGALLRRRRSRSHRSGRATA